MPFDTQTLTSRLSFLTRLSASDQFFCCIKTKSSWNKSTLSVENHYKLLKTQHLSEQNMALTVGFETSRTTSSSCPAV